MVEFLSTPECVRAWLDSEWEKALRANSAETDPDIDALVNSPVASIRFALVTQMLGKIADPSRSLLSLQLRAVDDGAWDARSFANRVVVPWNRDNHQLIGGSADPYVSNPLRRSRLDDEANVRNPGEWKHLVDFVQLLDAAPRTELMKQYERVRRSLARRLAARKFLYPIPQRIGQVQLERMVARFLEEPSNGLRPLAVATALFKTLGASFSLFPKVLAQCLHEADAASGKPGDIM